MPKAWEYNGNTGKKIYHCIRFVMYMYCVVCNDFFFLSVVSVFLFCFSCQGLVFCVCVFSCQRLVFFCVCFFLSGVSVFFFCVFLSCQGFFVVVFLCFMLSGVSVVFWGVFSCQGLKH